MARLVSINLSVNKGEQKKPVPVAVLKENWGLLEDAHAGEWHRQVSVLALESADKMRALGVQINHGDFAENLTTEGIDVMGLPLGTRLAIGSEAVVEITQIGKECHHGCAIRQKAGDCVMPREGAFARVIRGGEIRPGDEIVRLPWVIRVAILTASDKGARGERIDRSGEVIRERVTALPAEVVDYRLVSDDREAIREQLLAWCDTAVCDVILTTGGTGLAFRDVTPEATLDIAERLVPGIPEAMRMHSLKITGRAMLTRGVAVTRRRTLVVNLPGSPKAVSECLDVLLPELPHAVQILSGEGGECAR